MFGKITLAVAGLAAIASALPMPSVTRTVPAVDRYTFFHGDGSTVSGWPSQDNWASFEDLWNANVPLMQNSCGWNGWGADNTAEEIAAIGTAIKELASTSGVDKRFILAVMMQESKGCVRVPTTNNGVVNPGILQTHNGAGTCAGVQPCPASEINLMIADGVSGTAAGPGLKQLLSQARTATNDQACRAYYATARLYNSGSVDYSNLDNGMGSTACYASDIANRLLGWTLAPSTCGI